MNHSQPFHDQASINHPSTNQNPTTTNHHQSWTLKTNLRYFPCYQPLSIALNQPTTNTSRPWNGAPLKTAASLPRYRRCSRSSRCASGCPASSRRNLRGGAYPGAPSNGQCWTDGEIGGQWWVVNRDSYGELIVNCSSLKVHWWLFGYLEKVSDDEWCVVVCHDSCWCWFLLLQQWLARVKPSFARKNHGSFPLFGIPDTSEEYRSYIVTVVQVDNCFRINCKRDCYHCCRLTFIPIWLETSSS